MTIDPSPTASYYPIANLDTISFSQLFNRSAEETAKLVAACEKDGFFYLDLTEPSAGKLFRDLSILDGVVKKWFAQPLSEKMKTVTISNAHGPTGIQSGVTDATKDGFEALKIGRHELNGRWALPAVVEANFQPFSDFVGASHFILRTILECVSDGLNLHGADRLSQYHVDELPSKSVLYFLHYPAAQQQEVGQNMHTDVGTLTLLFAPQWGLQVLSPSSSTGVWEFVEPCPGHAIINVGDTLRFLSGRRFRSALHRALPLCEGGRYATSYFLRANDGVEFRDSEGGTVNAKNWFERKFAMYERPHAVQRSGNASILTGGMAEELNLELKATKAL